MCHRRSSAIRKNPPPLTYHLSRPPFYLARASKNNHPGHAPLLPIISLIYPHLSLRFPFLLSVFLPSRLPLIVFVFFCPRHCFALAVFCFLPLLFLFFPPYFPFLYLIISRSFSSTLFLVSSPPLSSPPHGKNAQSRSLKSQPNLHYPTPSFYPLITHSTPLA